MKKKFLWTFILVILSFVICLSLYSQFSYKEVVLNASIPYFSQDDLILKSELIVSGKVTDIKESKWSNPENVEWKRKVLQTDVEIEIEDIILGEYKNDTVTVRIDKGYEKKEKIKYISDTEPDFRKNEEVLLFLSRDDGDLKTNEDYFVVTGMIQGKWNIVDGKTENYYPGVDYDLEKTTVEDFKEKINSRK